MEEDASNGIMPLGTDAQTNTVQTQGQTKDSGYNVTVSFIFFFESVKASITLIPILNVNFS